MDKDIICRMRKLRKKAVYLNGTIEADLKSFLHKIDKITFRRLPHSSSIEKDTNVTTTCSCLMALAISGKLNNFYKEQQDKIKDAFSYVMHGDKDGELKSSGLEPCNAFTITLVLRTFGFLKQASIAGITSLDDFEHEKYTFKHKKYKDDNAKKCLTWIIKDLLEDPEEYFKINEYPATPTIIYWFVDSIERADVTLEKDKWEKLFKWAAKAFLSQLSRVSANQGALMDPISMAMAACLSAKLRNIINDTQLGATPELMAHLPSMVELRNSINILFEKQSDCGIWPKYFPLFHYGKDAGSNYCFTFEMLEAILSEFRDGILIDNSIDCILLGLENAVQWCYDNRMVYLHEGDTYAGWNSGGQLATLEAGKPESWATAIVHMFLYTLQDVLTHKIKALLLEEYKAIKYEKSSKKWDKLIDIGLESKQIQTRSTVKSILQKEIIDKIEYRGENKSIENRLSGLLFGPPGTSKTELVKALAQKIGWPLIMIDPSHFLSKGLERIYSEADNVFEDLLDLSDTVILFDEMDGLVRTRDEKNGDSLDITSRFLTTSMLPKLARLHDNKRSLFFMATNYIEDFDPAIKRPGRFDLLLCMWPPTWDEKIKNIGEFVRNTNVNKCQNILKEYTDKNQEICEALNLFTFGETKAFIEYLRDNEELEVALGKLTSETFKEKVNNYKQYIGLNTEIPKKIKQHKPYDRYTTQRSLSCLQ